MTLQDLNNRFGVRGQLEFMENPDGLIVVDIENPLASAKLALQGAHLLSWRPRSTSLPVVWLSESAQVLSGKPPHSGAPVCWPWFGAHDDPACPAHGFARNLLWDVVAAESEADGASQLTLHLPAAAVSAAQWPYPSELELTLRIGSTLRMTLATTNCGSESFLLGEALHTYFQVSDVEQVIVHGLEGGEYLDKVENFARKRQSGALAFNGETDRVYVDTEAECVIEDAGLRRRIRIAKSGSRTTVVWNPWQEKGAKMADVGEGWRRMLCVESANAAHNRVMVAPGETHVMAVEYGAEPMQ